MTRTEQATGAAAPRTGAAAPGAGAPSLPLADHSRRRVSSRGVAVAAGAISATALIGWIFNIPSLTEIIPGLVTTKFNAAAAIFLLSTTWFLPRRLAVGVTGVVGLLAGSTLIEFVGGLNLGVDELFIRDRELLTHPGRMAFTTAVLLLLLVWAVGMGALGRRRMVQPAAIVVLTAAALTLLGYLYGAPLTYYFGPFSTPALLTAIAVACLSIAVLLGIGDGGLWWLLRGRDAGAEIMRTLLPWTLITLPVLALLLQLGQVAGWYDSNLGLALTVGMAVLVLTVVAWKAAGALTTVDRRRSVALSDLEKLSGELEQRVQARTAELEQERAELRIAEAAARAASTDAMKANAAKDELFSRTSHELRTPLNAVLGFAQLLELGELSGDQQDAVAHILRSGRHLVHLVDVVLDIAKVNSGQLDVSIEVVPIGALLSEVVELITPHAATAGVNIDFHPDPIGPAVMADHRRLRQVLLTVLSNAIAFNHPGGQVAITSQIFDTHLRIAISDTGRGIRAADLPRLFTPFDRLGAEAAGVDGVGVALALSRRLMSLMGGTLTATSVEGEGSTFTASIPLANQPDLDTAAASAAQPTPQTSAEPAGPPRTLLYIEDNSSNVHLMEQIVTRRQPWHLVVAGLGALGLELAASTRPDLVLLDLHLPDMDGIDILRRLRADPHTSALKVIVLSADANPHQIDRLLAAGADRYLTKPLNVPAMLELLVR